MLNQVVLVGRLVRDPILNKSNNGEYSKITLAIPRAYKNINGEYESDFIDCTLWNNVASNTNEYCKKGDIVGIRGCLRNNNYEKEDKKVYSLEVIAEKVTFLSSKNKD